jgi:NADH:ubiquinone oxidoreductase subunit 5 (subunit L)/multisubunit Na+/H+ antiporter MnhA subunit
MEAPIPASSLIHSATLVSAGIYLILKFNVVFYYANLYSFIFILGSFTAFYGAVTAASQTDMKKLLAYSTISHCGFIFASLALNNFVVTVVYLYLHGLFKALTFFCAGSIVKFNNTQDTRQMGALKTQYINTIMLILSSINLGGLPYTFGYLYKNLFLLLIVSNPVNIVGYGFLVLAMLSSIVYVYKLVYYSCFDFRKGSQDLIILYLQNNINNNKYFITFFTFAKYIAFCIIYIFSFFFFIIVKYYILKNYFFMNYSEGLYTNNLVFLVSYLNLQKHLVSIFYILFVVTLVILLLQN